MTNTYGYRHPFGSVLVRRMRAGERGEQKSYAGDGCVVSQRAIHVRTRAETKNDYCGF